MKITSSIRCAFLISCLWFGHNQTGLSQLPEPIGIPHLSKGAEKFAIRGLRLGDSLEQVQPFVDTVGLKKLDVYGNENQTSIQGEKSLHSVKYTSYEIYSNGKNGPEEIRVRLSFTPPLATPRGVVQLVQAVIYTAHFGEGVGGQSILDDLVKRYGEFRYPPKGGYNASLPQANQQFTWGTMEYSYGKPILTAEIQGARSAGGRGTLQLELRDMKISQTTLALSRAYVDSLDADRRKDMKKPEF